MTAETQVNRDKENLGHVRRRTKSVTRAEEIKTIEDKKRKSQPDKPCHKPRDSLFTWSSGFKNFSGFVNWGFLLLFMGGVRLFLENLIKYGVRVDPEQWFIVLTGCQEGGPEHPAVLLIIYSVVPVVLCLLIEKGLSSEKISATFGIIGHVVNLAVLVLLPMVVIHVKSNRFSLVGATTVCSLYSILFLKLWSYVQVNLWCRQALHHSSKLLFRRQSLSANSNLNEYNHNKSEIDVSPKLVEYPNNLNLKDLFYFIAAPTLCYELNFPRTDRIRKRFLLKRLFEVVVLCQVMLSLFQQWIVPSVKHSLIPFSNMDLAKATERLLKLAIPNHLLWLMFFYLLFHSFLNLVGELLHFADRNFYSDWWNANNTDLFWRSWNTPVHLWALRHLYLPMIGLGYSKNVASTMVFFTSAFFHEYLVSVPLRTFKIWAFTGMMAQIPLSIVCRKVEVKYGGKWGNLIVWSSLIVGQPLCIMMYYHDYVITHFGKALIEAYGQV